MFGEMPRRVALFVSLSGIAFAAQDAGVWLDVPFVKQDEEACGAASVAMVMQYWQQQRPGWNIRPPDPATIQRALYSPRAHGIYASDLLRYFREQSFTTLAFPGNWNDLRQHLEKGRPLIVALKPRPVDAALHYVVVVGVNLKQNFVQVNDPAERKLLKEDRDDFEKEWKGAGHWTLLALPQPPASPH
jgi:ABC-type bacteriocin/lantibiotic exporter with double-glycine peptidase domain